jgi:transcriptional regulator with XRE-family HTH domain
MKFSKELSDETVLQELGHRLGRIRLDCNLSQAQVAEQAGVSKRTIERLESGSVAVQISGLIRVCKVLGIIERLDLLVPEPALSPIEQVKLRRRTRRRASPRKGRPRETEWKWGDQQ